MTKISEKLLFSQPIIVRNFLSIYEVTAILDCIRETCDLTENCFVPYRFSAYDWHHTPDVSASVLKFRGQFEDVLLNTVQNKFEKLFSDVTFKPISQNSKDETLNNLTIRIIQPKQSVINHHCENESIITNKSFFALLEKHINVWDMFSIVIMLQPPDFGGDIVVYNEKWESASLVDQQRQKLAELDKANFHQEHIKDIIHLNAGDLLIFCAGSLWHKVTEGVGAPRITVGAFAGKSVLNQGEYLYWS